jgi:hypothetical protein
MKIKKSKIALLLGSLLLLSMPLSSAYAHEDHCEIEDTQLGNMMKSMKSELRGYVKSFKADDPQKMQQHINELLTLNVMAAKQTPVKIKHMDSDGEMDHSKISMDDMDHSEMGMGNMSDMDHSKMNQGAMKMDSGSHDMSAMTAMDHSKMEHVEMGMESGAHDMSAMPSMKGMSAEQHHQHMQYMQAMTGLNDLFKQLAATQNKTDIKTILNKIKEHIRKSHRQFRQDCD